MYKYVLKRLMMMIPVLVGVLLIVFTINQLMAGGGVALIGMQLIPLLANLFG